MSDRPSGRPLSNADPPTHTADRHAPPAQGRSDPCEQRERERDDQPASFTVIARRLAADAFGDAAAYHQRVLPAPALLAVGLLLGLVVLLPAKRLQLAGLSSQLIGLYALFLWALAFLLVVRPVAARFLVPILIVAYIAPFVVAPGRVARLLRRGPGARRGPPRPPMKNVTPPDDPSHPG